MAFVDPNRFLLVWALSTLPGCNGQPADSVPASASASPVIIGSAPHASASAASDSVRSDRCASREPGCLSIERCAQGECLPACPPGEVYVPATGPDGFVLGSGTMAFAFGAFHGSHRQHALGDAAHVVVLTQPFCMDATEVTAGAYADCVEHHGCSPPIVQSRWGTLLRKQSDFPVDVTDHMMADYFCRAMGKELPTEAQWVWAATGGDGRAYPWGNEAPTCEHADFTDGPLAGPVGDYGCRGGGPSPVGSMPRGDKVWPAGHIHDLAGNVWEWVLDAYHPFAATREVDPLDTAVNGMYVIRGGGWNRSARGIRTDMRGGEPADYQRPALGFRCVRNPDPPGPLSPKLEELHRRERVRYGHRGADPPAGPLRSP